MDAQLSVLQSRLITLFRQTAIAPVPPIVLAVLAFGIWLEQIPQIRLFEMNDLGLVSVLPTGAYIAVGLMSISMCILFAQRTFRESVVLLHIILLIIMLYGIVTFVEEAPRFHVTWRHVGVSEYITRTGTVEPRINAYFNWPGFFILTAFLAEISGMPSTMSLAVWATVFFNLLFLGPLLMIFSALTHNRRLVWLAVWFYYITNWIGQDYFAPQALNYFFYLVLLAIVLTWLRPSTVEAAPVGPVGAQRNCVTVALNRAYRWLGTTDSVPNTISPPQRAAVVVVLTMVFAAMAPSHQLTPVITLGIVIALVALNRCTARGLPIILLVILTTWLVFMTTAYLSGHMHKVVGAVGEVTDNVTVNVSKRLRGSPGHLFVVQMRLVMTAVVGLAALAGMVVRWRHGYRDVILTTIAGLPWLFVIIQPYGGEMLLRAYFFALPGLSLFAAAAFFPTSLSMPTLRKGSILIIFSVLLIVGFLFARYGNERMNVFTQKEVEAVEFVYDIAEPGSLLVATSDYLTWKYRGFGVFRYKVVTREARQMQIEEIAAIMRGHDQGRKSYLILTRSQQAFFEKYLGEPPGKWKEFERALESSPHFKLIYSNDNARVFTLAAHPDTPPAKETP